MDKTTRPAIEPVSTNQTSKFQATLDIGGVSGTGSQKEPLVTQYLRTTGFASTQTWLPLRRNPNPESSVETQTIQKSLSCHQPCRSESLTQNQSWLLPSGNSTPGILDSHPKIQNSDSVPPIRSAPSLGSANAHSGSPVPDILSLSSDQPHHVARSDASLPKQLAPSAGSVDPGIRALPGSLTAPGFDAAVCPPPLLGMTDDSSAFPQRGLDVHTHISVHGIPGTEPVALSHPECKISRDLKSNLRNIENHRGPLGDPYNINLRSLNGPNGRDGHRSIEVNEKALRESQSQSSSRRHEGNGPPIKDSDLSSSETDEDPRTNRQRGEDSPENEELERRTKVNCSGLSDFTSDTNEPESKLENYYHLDENGLKNLLYQRNWQLNYDRSFISLKNDMLELLQLTGNSTKIKKSKSAIIALQKKVQKSEHDIILIQKRIEELKKLRNINSVLIEMPKMKKGHSSIKEHMLGPLLKIAKESDDNFPILWRKLRLCGETLGFNELNYRQCLPVILPPKILDSFEVFKHYPFQDLLMKLAQIHGSPQLADRMSELQAFKRLPDETLGQAMGRYMILLSRTEASYPEEERETRNNLEMIETLRSICNDEAKKDIKLLILMKGKKGLRASYQEMYDLAMTHETLASQEKSSNI